jgi:hypothetical protein
MDQAGYPQGSTTEGEVMARKIKIHYFMSPPMVGKALCGVRLTISVPSTPDPARVTCERCKGLL